VVSGLHFLTFPVCLLSLLVVNQYLTAVLSLNVPITIIIAFHWRKTLKFRKLGARWYTIILAYYIHSFEVKHKQFLNQPALIIQQNGIKYSAPTNKVFSNLISKILPTISKLQTPAVIMLPA
jgi:hypothetical protein